MSPVNSHKPIKIYKGGLILGVSTMYMLFCFFLLFAVVGKGLAFPQITLQTKIMQTLEMPLLFSSFELAPPTLLSA